MRPVSVIFNGGQASIHRLQTLNYSIVSGLLLLIRTMYTIQLDVPVWGLYVVGFFFCDLFASNFGFFADE